MFVQLKTFRKNSFAYTWNNSYKNIIYDINQEFRVNTRCVRVPHFYTLVAKLLCTCLQKYFLVIHVMPFCSSCSIMYQIIIDFGEGSQLDGE